MQNHSMKPMRSAARLVALVAALILPITVVAAFVLDRYNLSARLHQELEVRHKVLMLVHEIDRILVRHIAAAQTLALSPALTAGDLAAFRQHALRLREQSGADISISDGGTLPLFDTRPANATPLLDGPTMGRLLSGSMPRVIGSPGSEMTAGVAPMVVLRLSTPVGSGSPPLLVLHVPLGDIRRAVDQTQTPGWMVSIRDENGRVLAQSPPASPGIIRAGAFSQLERSVGDWSVSKATDQGGHPLFIGHARAQQADWLVTAEIRAAELQRRQHRALRDFALIGGLALLASLALALWTLRQCWPTAHKPAFLKRR